MAAEFVFTDPDTGLHFTWEGGEYIDIAASKNAQYPDANINVWDHASDTSEIDRTQEAFEAECRRWLTEDKK